MARQFADNVSRLGISRSKYYAWRDRYGWVNEHNAWVPRDFWLEDWEKQAIVAFYLAICVRGIGEGSPMPNRGSSRRMALSSSRRISRHSSSCAA